MHWPNYWVQQAQYPTAPRNGGGRSSPVTSAMLSALLEHPVEKPDQDLDEMVLYLCDEFEQLASRLTISRALSGAGWSRKTTRSITNGQNADLRDYYSHLISKYPSFQHVYVDKSGCDKWIGFRRRGWSPHGVTLAQIAQLHHGQRYQILPAYSQEGILLARVFQGNTDAAIFLDFIEQLEGHCNPFPCEHSVLIMDNASFHRTDEIEQTCARAGVKAMYLPG